MNVQVRVAAEDDLRFLDEIVAAINAEVDRGAVGMARRTPATLRERILAGDALVAVASQVNSPNSKPSIDWVGFCYLKPWENGTLISTSALIVRETWRRRGVARRLKEKALAHCRVHYPAAVPFGLSTSPAIERIHKDLKFRRVDYAELPRDPDFWRACESCPLYEDWLAADGKTCHCIAVRFDGDPDEQR